MEKKQKIFITCLIIYLIIVFGTEILYREKLYNKSVEYEEKIKQSGFLHYFFFFWSYIFIYGMMIIATLLVMFLYPYNVFLCYITIELILIIIMCLLKSIYTNSRPYWDIYNQKMKNTDNSDKPTECDGGFGNPSGHSLMATSFLNLWFLFINAKFLEKYKRRWKNLIILLSLILAILCIFCVIYSRIHRQIHSFNQIIFGSLLGISVFFTFCFIIEFNKLEPYIFFEAIHNIKYIAIFILVLIFGVSVSLGFTLHNEKEDDYEIVLKKYCNFQKEQIFGKNTAFHSGVIFILIGGFFGILFLKNKINANYKHKEEDFYYWNNKNMSTSVKIALFSFVLPAIPLIAVFLVPYKYFIIKFILEILLYFWYGFGAFGLCFYYGCVLFYKNTNKTLKSEQNVTIK